MYARRVLNFRTQFSFSRTVSTKVSLSGVFPPIVTPFDANEEVLLKKLRSNISIWKQSSFDGYTVLGSNGEFQYLSLAEKRSIVQTVREEEPKKTIIVGAGHESTKITKKYIKELSNAGGDVALIYTPCFYKNSMTPAALMNHYLDVADSSPIPIILYNVPANTGLDLPVKVVISLAKHENIIGIKESGGNVVRIAEIVHRTKEFDFDVVAGSAGFMVAAYSVGAVGVVAALANVMGDKVCDLHQSIISKEDCLDLQNSLIAPNTALTATFGPAGLKFVCDNIGLYGGPCRSPIQPLTLDQKKELSLIMSEVGVECDPKF